MQMKIVQLQMHKKNFLPLMKALFTNNTVLGCLVQLVITNAKANILYLIIKE